MLLPLSRSSEHHLSDIYRGSPKNFKAKQHFIITTLAAVLITSLITFVLSYNLFPTSWLVKDTF